MCATLYTYPKRHHNSKGPHSEASCPLKPFIRANHPVEPAEPSSIYTRGALNLLPILVPPDAILLDRTVDARILITSQGVDPRPADLGTVDHDIDLLAVEPGLRVLITVPSDADLLVHDHQLDVATALLLFRRYRTSLIFRYVPVPPQMLPSGGRERGI